MKYLNPVLLIMSLLGLPALAQDLASLSELGQGNELELVQRGEGNQAHLWQLADARDMENPILQGYLQDSAPIL